MKIDRKPNSQVRAEKEKLVMENFASVMKKLDATFLIENEVNEVSDEKKAEHAKDADDRSDFGDSVSNCCGAKFKQGDVCSSCGEHASPDKKNIGESDKKDDGYEDPIQKANNDNEKEKLKKKYGSDEWVKAQRDSK